MIWTSSDKWISNDKERELEKGEKVLSETLINGFVVVLKQILKAREN